MRNQYKIQIYIPKIYTYMKCIQRGTHFENLGENVIWNEAKKNGHNWSLDFWNFLKFFLSFLNLLYDPLLVMVSIHKNTEHIISNSILYNVFSTFKMLQYFY
jgi:hypothetical protein